MLLVRYRCENIVKVVFYLNKNISLDGFYRNMVIIEKSNTKIE